MSSQLDYQQKFSFIHQISTDVYIKMRKPDDWYVGGLHAEVKQGSILRSISGNGSTPEKAVENAWENLIKQPIVLDAYRDTRRTMQWNGKSWSRIE